MEGIQFTKRPRLKNPYLIVAWPGMGEVAFKAASYLVEKLKAEEFAEIEPEDFFYLTASSIRDGVLNVPDLPQSKFYFWKNPATKRSSLKKAMGEKSEPRDLIIFLSNAQPDLAKAETYSKRIMHIAKLFNAERIVGFASMPAAIDHTLEPEVFCASTHADLNEDLKKYDCQLLSEGQISGMNGLFLGIAKKEGLKGFCLLAEIPLYTIQIENPKAAYAVLTVFARIANIPLDLSDLVAQSQVIEGEINKLLDYLKLSPQSQSAPIGEEEIEKIKKTLSQLTKLPVSVKERIEKLFEQAKLDIAKAHELKAELDRWSVYKEYEDRFLDLFRKTKDKGN